MNIKRIKYFIVLLVIFFSFVNIAHASDVIINEFVSHPNSGEKEWVELRNTKGVPINLDGWKLTEFSSPDTNPIEKELLLLSGTINDVLVFEVGTTKLNDGGDSIGLYDGVKEMDRVTYGKVLNMSADLTSPPQGKSGALISGSWTTNQEPTKNSANSSTDSSDNSSEDTPVDETVDPIPVNNNTPVVYKISTKIIAPKIVTAGVPFVIDHTTTGINKEKVILGKFIWNFGDGMSKSSVTSDAFNYVYDYPGDYVITLSYLDSTFDTKPDATDRLIVKVIPSGIVISSVGTYTDPFVELENKSSYEMSISGWILKGRVRTFMIPEGTVILSNKKLKLSPKITGFDFNDLSSISIIDTSGQVFATYPNIIKPIIKYSANKNSVENIVKSDIVESSQIDNIANSPDVINLNDLGASAGSIDNGLNNKTLIYLGLAGIIIIGIVSIFLLRCKTEVPDYIDKGIRADDMKIIE